MELHRWLRGGDAPDGLRVVTVYHSVRGQDWPATIAKLGIADGPRWTNVVLPEDSDERVVKALGIDPSTANETFLLDPSGCVVHSSMMGSTSLPVIRHVLAERETCAIRKRRGDAPGR